MDEQLADANADLEQAESEVNKLKSEKKKIVEELQGTKKVCFGFLGKFNVLS